MIDWTKPLRVVLTSPPIGAAPAELLKVSARPVHNSEYTHLVGWSERGDYWVRWAHNKNGDFGGGRVENVPEKIKVEGWANVYQDKDRHTLGCIYPTLEAAQANGSFVVGRVGIVRLDLEVEKGANL